MPSLKLDGADADTPRMETIKQFEVGAQYTCSSICDSDAVWAFTVARRTAKTVWLINERGETVRRKVRIYDGTEVCDPLGQYSMSPTLRAGR